IPRMGQGRSGKVASELLAYRAVRAVGSENPRAGRSLTFPARGVFDHGLDIGCLRATFDELHPALDRTAGRAQCLREERFGRRLRQREHEWKSRMQASERDVAERPAAPVETRADD